MSVSLGENSKLAVNPSERSKIRTFYKDILGCQATKESERIDVFKIGNTFYLGAMYDDSALTHEDSLKSIWLELRTGDSEGLKRKILDFGIKELEYWDKEHFYFQAPGGQVFRLTDGPEDLSKPKS